MRQACERAGIVPSVGFHVLRHTHASILAMRAVPTRGADGGDRAPARPRRHPHDREALRAPRAELCRRHDPGKFPATGAPISGNYCPDSTRRHQVACAPNCRAMKARPADPRLSGRTFHNGRA
jgi:hypothetical protein